jgi:hypothetical protein
LALPVPTLMLRRSILISFAIEPFDLGVVADAMRGDPLSEFAAGES